jgi:hypothetical protein
LSSVGFSSIDSKFTDPRDAACVRQILQDIGILLPIIESADESLKIIAQAILSELRIITNGDGYSDSQEKLINLQINTLQGFISNTRKR